MKNLSLLLGIALLSAIQLWAQESPYRIAVLGCHKQFRPAPALVRYVESKPDLCLWIGDNIYADTQGDVSYLDSCYRALAAKPAFRQLRAMVPQVATWDDHDYGDNDEWKDYPLKKESKDLFRRFWNLEEQIPEDQEGIYYTHKITVAGRTVQIILLDVRYHRDEPGPEADMLGEAQWAWLEKQLKQPADLRLLVSGTQVLLTKDAGSETWDEYPIAKNRLFELIRRCQAEGLVFITGDQHYGEVARLDGALDYDAIELQFAGINQNEDPEFNPLRVANAATALHSYALLDLEFETTATEVPHLSFRIYDALTDKLELSYRVNLSELFLDVEFDLDTAFIEKKEVNLRHSYPNLALRYTLNGAPVTASSPLYKEPFLVKKTTEIKARLFDQGEGGYARSKEFTQIYEKLDPISAVSVKGTQPGLLYQYVEGNFKQMPNFSDQEVLREGVAQDFDVAKLGRKDHFAVVYQGYFRAPETGLYDFTLTSDDGSILYLHNRQVVNNDGSHSRRSRSGRQALEKGLHPFMIEYFEDYEGQALQISVSGPDLLPQSLPFNLLSHQ